MSDTMKRIVLAKRPVGLPQDECFRLEDAPLPELKDGEVLVKVRYMSLDPYMRGRMDDAESYATPVEVGNTMEGGAVGEVIDSKYDGLSAGDSVLGMFGWATHAVQPGKQVRKIDPDAAPISTALGVLGMPGFTAWAGLTAYGDLKEGQTVVVGAATGPVGSMVGQLAKLKGCRVVGVAGGAEKCKMAVETFGFDACVDHRANDGPKAMREALAAECPDGVDLYFENVGGDTLGGVLPLMKIGARIIVCGMIAWYNGATDETGQIPLAKMWRRILVKRLQIFGLLQTDHVSRFKDFVTEVAPKVKSGEIAYVEDVAEGLENAPEAFRSLLTGGNKGKQVVKVS